MNFSQPGEQSDCTDTVHWLYTECTPSWNSFSIYPSLTSSKFSLKFHMRVCLVYWNGKCLGKYEFYCRILSGGSQFKVNWNFKICLLKHTLRARGNIIVTYFIFIAATSMRTKGQFNISLGQNLKVKKSLTFI